MAKKFHLIISLSNGHLIKTKQEWDSPDEDLLKNQTDLILDNPVFQVEGYEGNLAKAKNIMIFSRHVVSIRWSV